ncbi:MAG: hypothetical protein WCR01_15100 [Bacteroidota bacterium]|jgi:hypothetical protein
MTFLPITYDKVLKQLTATVNESMEIKVGYSMDDNTVSVIKKGVVLKTDTVPYNYPAREFVEYCFRISKVYIL